MPLARINGRILNFVHIPKTGGSSVKSYLMSKGPVALYSRDPTDWARTTPQHIDAATRALLVPDAFCDAGFAVLRDPVNRMVSEFRYRATRCLKSPAAVHNISSSAPMQVELGPSEYACLSFDAWVDTVFERFHSDPFICDNHIRPQSDFLNDGLHLFLLEEGLEKVMRWIDEFTQTAPSCADLDRNQSLVPNIEVCESTKWKIENFYRHDLLRIGQEFRCHRSQRFARPTAEFLPVGSTEQSMT